MGGGVRTFQMCWLLLSLILTSILSSELAVHLPSSTVFARAGSSVVLPCSYDYPQSPPLDGGEQQSYNVLSKMWCLGEGRCITPRYVYHSAGIFPEPAYQGRVQFLGEPGSRNCSLLISDLRTSDSGTYVFYFITSHPKEKLPAQPGVKLLVSGREWAVSLPSNSMCARSGSSVVLPCSYDYPRSPSPDGGAEGGEQLSYTVLSKMWCLGESRCITPRYVYHSAGIFPEPAYQGRVQFLGESGSSNCSLRIDDLRTSDSGTYVFYFITSHPKEKLPAQPGVKLLVAGHSSEDGFSLTSCESTAVERMSMPGHRPGILAGVIAVLLVVLVLVTVAYIRRRRRSESRQQYALTVQTPP